MPETRRSFLGQMLAAASGAVVAAAALLTGGRALAQAGNKEIVLKYGIPAKPPVTRDRKDKKDTKKGEKKKGGKKKKDEKKKIATKYGPPLP
jgi:hypothetical protein